MSAFSDYLENIIIDHLLRNQPFTPPTTLYLALYTTAPTDAGGGVEVSGGGYARQAITLSPATGGQTSNSTNITFPTATASWGTVVAVGIFDAVSAGNLLLYGNLTTSKTINNGDTFVINANNLTISVD